MPIAVECPKCQTGFRVPEKLLGKTIRCKACEASIPVREPEAEEAVDETENQESAPLKKKKKKKKQPSGYGNMPIILGVGFVLLLIVVGVCVLLVQGTGNNANIAAPNAADGVKPQPNNGQRVTDPDQIVSGRYPASKEMILLDIPEKGRMGGAEFGYTISDPKTLEVLNKTVGAGGRTKRGSVPAAPADPDDLISVFIVTPDGQTTLSSLKSHRWELKGAITVRLVGKAMPSGSRLCLVQNSQRISNVINAP